MELWVAGFNAWGQLNWEKDTDLSEAHDVSRFQCALRDPAVEMVSASLSTTLVKTSSGLRLAGAIDVVSEFFLEHSVKYGSVAVAGNDKWVTCESGTLKEYSSSEQFLVQDGRVVGHIESIVQLTANQTTFTALSETGEVWSWGDGRYEACLGRDVSVESPATIPVLIADLSDLPTGPIRKISSGGYVTAALTEGNDLYIWGGRLGQQKLLQTISGLPTPVDLDGEDIQDVAVGHDHMLAMTTTNKLFVVGSGSNGQLGIDTKHLGDWHEVVLPIRHSQRIRGLGAGYKNSFVIVEEIV